MLIFRQIVKLQVNPQQIIYIYVNHVVNKWLREEDILIQVVVAKKVKKLNKFSSKKNFLLKRLCMYGI